MKSKLCLLLLIVSLIFGSNVAQAFSVAESVPEQISSFDSQVHISKDNQAEVTETIIYNFGALQRHGIYRDIPIDYKDSEGNVYRLALDYHGTVDEYGHGVKSETSKSSGNFRIRLGEADKLITGVHTYKISYKLWPIITQKDQKGFLAFDVTGNGWQVPINHVTAEFKFDGIELQNPTCFTGESGSTQKLCTANGSKFTADNLKAGEGLSTEGSITSGYVTKYLQANQNRPLTKSDMIMFAVFAVIGLGVLVFIVILTLRNLRKKRRRKNQTVVAEYEPPKGLSVAEIGHLEDDVSSTREVTAIIIDLAVRGYLKIEETQKKSFLKKAKYTLVKLKEPQNLSIDEKSLYDTIFAGATDDKIEIDNLSKSAMSTTITKIHSNTKKSLKTKGFYASISTEPNILEKMLDAGNITDEGAKVWAKVDGFKLFLNVTEKDRIKFHDAPDRTPEMFSKFLPYAVAMGVEKEWAKQFEGIDVTQTTNNWYTGSYAGFSAVSLANDLSSSFAPVVSSNSSVSSSGGGGSSGGGFGGGGGGSW